MSLLTKKNKKNHFGFCRGFIILSLFVCLSSFLFCVQLANVQRSMLQVLERYSDLGAAAMTKEKPRR